MKTNIHFLLYLAQFFLECKMFQTKVADKIKTHILSSITFFFRKWIMWKKNCRGRQATDDSMAHVHCMLYTQGCRHTLRIYNICFSTAKNGTTKAPPRYLICTLPVLHILPAVRLVWQELNSWCSTTCEFCSILSRPKHPERKAYLPHPTLFHNVWFCFTHTHTHTLHETARET